MDGATKQKVLVGVLAVIVLGGGVWFFALRDSGTTKTQVNTGPIVKKVRREAPKMEKKKKEREAPEAKAAAPTERKVRYREEPEEVQKKTRKAQERKKATKKFPGAAFADWDRPILT